jgi:hypothetical protein
LSFTKERDPQTTRFHLVLTLILPMQIPTRAPTQIICLSC